MVSVAVTGGIGSGKSAVCEVFRAMRVPVLSADELSKKIADTRPGVRRRITTLLGPGAYTARGRLDRQYVAGKVFGRPALLRKLESILHPAVLKEVRSWLASHKRRGTRVVAVEAALVFESGLDTLVDLVLVVDAPKESRVRRIHRRDGMSASHIRKRMAAQMPDKERRSRADIVLRNNGTLPVLRRRARFLVQVLRRLSA